MQRLPAGQPLLGVAFSWFQPLTWMRSRTVPCGTLCVHVLVVTGVGRVRRQVFQECNGSKTPVRQSSHRW